MWSGEELEQVRIAELQKILPLFGDRRRVLEIGAGAGWQARHLAEQGFEVTAIEYASPAFADLAKERVWPVEYYDGYRLPFPDNAFDIVFSSNVLEHIPHVLEFQQEIRRVLKDEGIAVHLMPTASWRFWTLATHYIFMGNYLAFRLISRLRKKSQSVPVVATSDAPAVEPANRLTQRLPAKLIWILVPTRHGEEGNVITEHFYFSRWKWRSLFARAGFEIVSEGSAGIFYTGYGILAGSLHLSIRKNLSRVLRGSCRYWVLSLPSNPFGDRQLK